MGDAKLVTKRHQWQRGRGGRHRWWRGRSGCGRTMSVLVVKKKKMPDGEEEKNRNESVFV
jgi:hypothetical protein